MQHLLASLDPGGLSARTSRRCKARLDAIIGAGDASAGEVRRRIRLISLGVAQAAAEHFSWSARPCSSGSGCGSSTTRAAPGDTEREVSPQRLVHYRENWYLDTWCHLRNDLRSFAVDAIRRIEVVDARRRRSRSRRWTTPGAGYGISGGEVAAGELRFRRARALGGGRDLAPEAEGQFDADGSYILALPCRDDRELIIDILRYGADFEVLAPTRAALACRKSTRRRRRSTDEHAGNAVQPCGR